MGVITRGEDYEDSIFKHDLCKLVIAKMCSTITDDGTGSTKSGKERFKNFANYSGVIGWGERHFAFNPVWTGILTNSCASLYIEGSWLLGREEGGMRVREDQKNLASKTFLHARFAPFVPTLWAIVASSRKSRASLSDFLVLKFILIRVLKSGKMIGGQILCSFFVSDDNIEFLEQNDPPHQSWLSIFLSEDILYSRMVGIYYALRQNKI
ncbi:hypothetical protein Tco_1408700 [Tanacetum coccineum]